MQPKVTEEEVPGRAATSRPGSPYLPELAVRLCGALLALAISTVHVADQGGVTAMADPSWIGWGYRLIEIGGVLAAIAVLVPWPSLLSRTGLSGSAMLPWSAGLGWAGGVLLGIGPFIMYIASRSVGVPGDHGDVGNWGDWLGTVSLFVEAAMVVLSVAVLLAIWQSGRSASAAARAGELRLSTVRQTAERTGSDLSK